jgi:hypothetical protein
MPVLTVRRLGRLLALLALPALASCGGGDASSESPVSGFQNQNLPQAQPDEGAENNAATVVSTALTVL